MRYTLPLTLALLACNSTTPAPGDSDLTGDADTDTDTDTIYVSPTAPVAIDDAFSVDEGGLHRPEILANDSDPNDEIDLATIVLVTDPANGQISVSPQGVIEYSHDSTETLSDSFTYTVDDITGETSNIATVTVTVNPVNDPPVAVDDAGAVADEGGGVTIDVAGNDTDPDDLIDIGTIQITTPPARGTATANPDGTVDYTNNGSESAQDQFRYNIRDLSGAVSNSAVVDITINPVNDPPTAVDDVLAVAVGVVGSRNLSLNDLDPDDGVNVASITIVTQPNEGTVVVNLDGSVDYTHNGSPNYIDAFTYTIQDNSGAISNIANVDVQVNDGTGTHMTEPFYPTNSDGQFCGGAELVWWSYMGEMTFDDCQDLANRTGTQWYVGQSTNYTSGWIGDQDGVATAAMTGNNWTTEDIVPRYSFYSCVLGDFEHRTEATVFPFEQIYVDFMGRTWHYWDLQGQTASQAISFADDRGARIINPNSVGLNGLTRMTAPTHWCHASAEYNGGSNCNTDVICDFMIGYYE